MKFFIYVVTVLKRQRKHSAILYDLFLTSHTPYEGMVWLGRWLDYEGLVGQVARSQLPQCPSTCWSEESVLVEHQGLPKPAFTQVEYFLPVNISILFKFTAHNGFYLRKLHTTQEFSRGEFVTLYTYQNL